MPKSNQKLNDIKPLPQGSSLEPSSEPSGLEPSQFDLFNDIKDLDRSGGFENGSQVAAVTGTPNTGAHSGAYPEMLDLVANAPPDPEPPISKKPRKKKQGTVLSGAQKRKIRKAREEQVRKQQMKALFG